MTAIVCLLLAGIVFLCLVFLVGRWVSSWVLSPIGSFDNGLVFGLFLISAVFGVGFAYGQSVYALPVFLAAGLWFFRMGKAPKPDFRLAKEELKSLYTLVFYFVFLFFLQVFIFYVGDGEWAKVYADNYAYVAQINLMASTHKEAVFLELEKIPYGFPALNRPYHYFEFWLAVAGKLLSGQSGFLTYTLFLIPVLGSVLLFQAFAFCRSWFKIGYVLSVLLPVLVFFTLRYSYLDEWLFILLRDQLELPSKIYKAAFFQNYGFWHFFSYLHGLKLIITGIFLFPAVYHLIRREEKGFLAYFTLLPLVSLSYVPFTAVFLGLYVAVRIRKGLFSPEILWPVASILFVFAYYFFVGQKSADSGFHLITLVEKNLTYLVHNFNKEIFIWLSDFFENYYWIVLLPLGMLFIRLRNGYTAFLFLVFVAYPLVNFQHKVYFKVFLVLLLAASILALFKLPLRKHLNSPVLLLVVTLLILRLILFLIGNVYDIFQIYSLIATPLVYLFSFVLFSKLFAESGLARHSVAITLVVFCFIGINTYGVVKENRRAISQLPEDRAFTEKIKQWSGDKPIISAYYSPFTVKPYLHYDRLGVELLHHTDRFYSTCLGMDQLTPADTAEMKLINGYLILQNLPFSLWLKEKADGKSTYWQEQLRFINTTRIRVIFRKEEYDRQKLNFLQPLMLDSVYNHQGKYWSYLLNTN